LEYFFNIITVYTHKILEYFLYHHSLYS
jgi:hypothetical protein